MAQPNLERQTLPLMQSYHSSPDAKPLVRQIGEWPDHHRPIGEIILRVGAEWRMGENRITSGRHNGKSPRRDFQRIASSLMDDAMLHRDLGTCLVQPDDHLATNLRRRLDPVRDPDGELVLDLVCDLAVIERIAEAVLGVFIPYPVKICANERLSEAKTWITE